MTIPTIDGFVIESELGRGARAVVHRARHADGSGSPVAIKIAQGDGYDVVVAFDHEAATLRRLEQRSVSGVVRLVDRISVMTPDHGEQAALITEPVGVANLAELLVSGDDVASPETAPPRRSRSVFADLVGVLAAIHEAGIVHGDVCPNNIVVLDDGSAMLVDFDRAIVDGDTPLTAAGGTPPFAAPEVLDGATPTSAADVFGIGMTMVLALLPAGARAPTPHAARRQLLEAGCSTALTDVLAPTIDPSPANRPTARELHESMLDTGPVVLPARVDSVEPVDGADLRTIVTREFGPRLPRPAPPVVATPSTLRHVATCAAAVAGIVLIAMGALSLRATGEPSAPSIDTVEATATRGENAPCPGSGVPSPTPTPNSTTPATTVVADIDGSDCPAAIEWRASTADAIVHTAGRTRHYRLGVPGDVLLVGDWDGDRRASPALYRPSTGEVFRFDGWASSEDAALSVDARNTGVVDGHATVRRAADRDVVDVDPATQG